MKNNNNARKGRAAEERAVKKLGAIRKAGPNSPDLKKGKDKFEVKTYKNPMTKAQLQKAKQQNNADVIVSESGFTKDALDHARKRMNKTQLRGGKGGGKLVKKRK